MIYLVLLAVAACDFLFLYNLARFGYWLCLGIYDRNLHNVNRRIRSSSIFAATWLALSAAIIRAWEMGVIE